MLSLHTIVFKCLGFSDDQIIPCLPKLSPPPGRMQQLANSNIWIDYAHTPDALDNALSTLRMHYPEFNIRVFLVVVVTETRAKDR